MNKQTAGIALLRLGQEMKRIVDESCGSVTFMSISAYDNGSIVVRVQDESDGINRINIPLDAVLFSDGVARVNGEFVDLDGEEGAA